jgi:transposase-like protein
VALDFVARLRWPDSAVCPRCEGKEYSYLTTRRLWKCQGCKKQYSAKKGKIFEDSPLGFDKWLPAVWLVLNCKNGISSHELARALGVHQQTAWFMLGRVRLAMEQGSFEKLSGEAEADETYVGGKGFNMHKSRKAKYGGKRGIAVNKTAVMGIKQCDGKIVAKVVENTKRPTIHAEVHRHVEKGSTLYSDKLLSYTGLEGDFDHQVIDHARSYVEGRVHTNQLENFWALQKRALKGTYVSVDPEHLGRYVAEQVCRFNARHDVDSGRFTMVLGRTEGKRLTYRELTGKAR